MRQVIVRRLDRAHRGPIMVLNLARGTGKEIPQGEPVKLSARLVRELRSARVAIYTQNGRRLKRSVRRVYSVRQVRA